MSTADMFGKPLGATQPSRPAWPAMPRICQPHDAVTPLFQARMPHLISPFQWDPKQRGGPKYSVQAEVDASALGVEELEVWAALRSAVERHRPDGGVTPFDEPGGVVRFNMSCFRAPEAHGRLGARVGDSGLAGAWMRAWVTLSAYGAFSGRPGGVLLGLRAFELVDK